MDLVTGATGIVGAHVLLECAQRGAVRAIHRVRSDRSIVERIFRFYRADGEALLQRIDWREAGLEDTDALDEAMRDIRHVYHAAAVVSFDPRDTGSMERVNVAGTANVVNTALANGVERLCHVSSTATIGEAPAGVPRDETLPWSSDGRRSVYAMTKYAAELEVYRGIAEGLDAIMVNPCIVLGPGLPGRSSMTLVERLNRGTRFYPPGANAVVDARDVARCMVALMDRGTSGERYLLVGENLTYQRLFTLLSEAFGRKPPTWPLRSWMLEAAWRLERARSMLTGATPFITEATAHSAITHRTYDPTKVSDLLGYRFLGAAEAITNVAAFLRHRGSA